MIHPGDRVHNAIVLRDYIVVRVSQNSAVCKSVDVEGEYINAALDVVTLETAEPKVWLLVSCPHEVAPVSAHAVLFDTSVYYAGVIGMLSYRLEDTHQCAIRAQEALESGNTYMALYHLEWVQKRIEETAVALVTKPAPEGAMSMSYLRDRLYQNRK